MLSLCRVVEIHARTSWRCPGSKLFYAPLPTIPDFYIFCSLVVSPLPDLGPLRRLNFVHSSQVAEAEPVDD